MQQWGLQRMTTSYTTYYLPISYSESHIAILGQEQERNKGLGLSPEGLNGYIAAITYSGDTQNIRYLSIGYQQWGYEYNVSSKTIEYPIAYSTIAPTVVTSSNGADAKSAVGTITMTSFSAINRAGPQSVWWFSIGIQQWGTADGTRGNFTTNLNVPYLNFYLPYASSTNTYGTGIWTVSARVETDLSKIGLSSESNFEIIWLAIGM